MNLGKGGERTSGFFHSLPTSSKRLAGGVGRCA